MLVENPQEGKYNSSVPKILDLFNEGAGIRESNVFSQPNLLWISVGNGEENPCSKYVSPKSLAFSPLNLRVQSRPHDDHPPQ